MGPMDDTRISEHIEQLVAEERLERIRLQLDRYWDLLRQRRARESAGLDPDDASPRGDDTVEGYLQ